MSLIVRKLAPGEIKKSAQAQAQAATEDIEDVNMCSMDQLSLKYVSHLIYLP